MMTVAIKNLCRRLLLTALALLVLAGPCLTAATATVSADAGDTRTQQDIFSEGIYRYDLAAGCTADGTSPALNSTTDDGVAIDDDAGQAAAKAAGGSVGYALYDSTGAALAEYQSSATNTAGSIPKSLELVAFLNKYKNQDLSSTAQTHVTKMIEQSSDQDANWVFDVLAGGTGGDGDNRSGQGALSGGGDFNTGVQAVNKVAQAAGMQDFKIGARSPGTYVIGKTLVSSRDFALFFSKIDTYFPAKHKTFALKLLSTITPQAGLLQAGLPGTVYSKEGWSDESASFPGTPYIVNQAAQFSSGGKIYGIAVTVGGTTDEAKGESIVKSVATALLKLDPTAAATSPSDANGNCCDTDSGGAATQLSGKDNLTKIYNYLASKDLDGKKLNNTQILGILGNMKQESGFSPTAQNPSGAYGIAQWTKGRLSSMEAFASKEGKDKSDLGAQLDYLWHELTSGYKDKVLVPLLATTDLSDAVDVWLRHFEIPCSDDGCWSTELNRRLGFANDVAKQLGTGGGSDSTPDTDSTGSSGCDSGSGTAGGPTSGANLLALPAGATGRNVYYVNQTTDLGAEVKSGKIKLDNGYDFGTCGCGPTAALMVQLSFKSTDGTYDSATINSLLAGLHKTPGAFDGDQCGTSDPGLSKYFAGSGYTVKTVHAEVSGQKIDDSVVDSMKNYLKQGYLLMDDVRGSFSFTSQQDSSGHHTVIYGYNNDGFFVANPGYRQDSFDSKGKPYAIPFAKVKAITTGVYAIKAGS